MQAGVSGLPSAADKPRFVSRMFDRIARRYDVMNTLMTLGMDQLWRRVVAGSIGTPTQVLDVGTGTAKLAQAIQRQHPGARVYGVDFSELMLRAGARAVPLATADALALPFADASFDAVTSAFLVRNLADLPRGVQEQARVLRTGGRLAILETTPGPRNVLRPLFRLYFRGLVPILGSLIAGDPHAYTYLPESSAAFAEPEAVAAVLERNGFGAVAIRRLAFGCVAIVSAERR